MPVIVQNQTAPPTRAAQTGTGTLFMPAVTERGPVTGPVLCTSFQQWKDTFGGRLSYSNAYDCAEAFFREGGSRLITQRYVGPAAVTAKIDLNNGAAAATLKVSAISPGPWGNALSVEVQAGVTAGTFVLVIRKDGVIVETSPELADETAAAAWAAEWVVCSDLGASGDPAVVAATALTGGVDDNAAITDTQRTNALALFTRSLGPGQVVLPGDTRTAAHDLIRAHAADRGRVALGDQPDTATLATITGAVTSQRNAATAPELCPLFGPPVSAPGVAAGTVREIPASIIAAAKIAQTDALFDHPNEPAAGDRSTAVWVTDVKRSFTDTEYDTLRSAGANMLRVIDGVVQLDGYRTPVDPVQGEVNLQLSNVRLDMLIRAAGREIAQRYAFRQIDGKGQLAAAYGGELDAFLSRLYGLGALFGETKQDAFTVDVGPTVNTPVTIGNRELRAVIGVRRSPFAEVVYLTISNRLVTEAL